MPARQDTCRCDHAFTCAVCLSGNRDSYAQRPSVNQWDPEIDQISAELAARKDAELRRQMGG